MPALVYAVNFVLLFLIVRYEYNSNNDKTIIISSLAFIALLCINLLLGLFARLNKKTIYRHYNYSALALVICVFVLLAVW
jgi:hypothetical protein